MKLNYLFSLFLALCCFSLQAEDLQKKAENRPLFEDGKGYYSYKQPLKLELAKDRVTIHYFFSYGCASCLNADDYLRQYARLHSDKVELVRLPSFEQSSFTATMHEALVAYGRPDLSDQYLFDSTGGKKEARLINSNPDIARWLIQKGVDLNRFKQLYHSEFVTQKVAKDRERFEFFKPPMTPMAVLNGKYILVKNTLYNDDYTYAVLDFLVEKLQQEQKEGTQ